MLLRPTFTAPLCATRLENRMERLGSRLAPNDGHVVELYSISPHLETVRSGAGAPAGGVRGENREYYS